MYDSGPRSYASPGAAYGRTVLPVGSKMAPRVVMFCRPAAISAAFRAGFDAAEPTTGRLPMRPVGTFDEPLKIRPGRPPADTQVCPAGTASGVPGRVDDHDAAVTQPSPSDGSAQPPRSPRVKPSRSM